MITLFQFLHESYSWLPGGAYVPLLCAISGLFIGLAMYVRSFKYLYAYYIEHGVVVCWMENYVMEMKLVAKKHKLKETVNPMGYVSGLFFILILTLLGTLIGTTWPISVVIGILTIPNFALRYLAKERRAKAVFEQKLNGDI